MTITNIFNKHINKNYLHFLKINTSRLYVKCYNKCNTRGIFFLWFYMKKNLIDITVII